MWGSFPRMALYNQSHRVAHRMGHHLRNRFHRSQSLNHHDPRDFARFHQTAHECKHSYFAVETESVASASPLPLAFSASSALASPSPSAILVSPSATASPWSDINTGENNSIAKVLYTVVNNVKS
nr:hypothetical protein [Crucivirus sp.]